MSILKVWVDRTRLLENSPFGVIDRSVLGRACLQGAETGGRGRSDDGDCRISAIKIKVHEDESVDAPKKNREERGEWWSLGGQEWSIKPGGSTVQSNDTYGWGSA